MAMTAGASDNVIITEEADSTDGDDNVFIEKTQDVISNNTSDNTFFVGKHRRSPNTTGLCQCPFGDEAG
jgi:hypothetical protein